MAKEKIALSPISCSVCRNPAGMRIPIHETEDKNSKIVGYIPNTIRKIGDKYYCPLCYSKKIKEVQDADQNS